MRKLILLIAFCCTAYFTQAQGIAKLIGLRYDGTRWLVDSLSFPGHHMTDLDTLTNITAIQSGESTFDPVNKRYFHYSDRGIIVVDANTGTLLDSFPDTLHLLGLEYDPEFEKLYAIYPDASLMRFVSVDPDSGTITILDTLDGINTEVNGVTTFDMCSHTYYFESDENIIAVNANTGAIIDSIPRGLNEYLGLESGGTGVALYGLSIRDTMVDFVRINPYTKTQTVKSSLSFLRDGFYPGETTFSRDLGFYVLNTPSYIYVLDTAGGSVVDTISNTNNLLGLEAVYNEYCIAIDGIQETEHQSLSATVFPNPASEKASLRFNEPVTGASIEVIDFSGKRVSYIQHFSGSVYTADLSGLPDGLYLLRVADSSRQATFKVVKK